MTDTSTTPQKKSRHHFFFKTSLYKVEVVEDYDAGLFAGEVDGYNHIQNCETTYQISSDIIDVSGPDRGKYRVIKLECKRYGDELRFFVYLESYKTGGGEVTTFLSKIGQQPSLATISSSEVKEKYKKYADEEHLKLYQKATGLYAHGAGAGALVYLRKIFEHIINEKFIEQESPNDAQRREFRHKRMEEKIKVVKASLPSRINSFKSVYALMSDGIHNLTEEQCLDMFEPLRFAIELIWKDQKARKLEEEEEAAINKQISDFAAKSKTKE